MSRRYIPRALEPVLRKAAAQFPALLLTGPRHGEEPQVHFWRTSAGVEVDLVVEAAGKLFPIEVKLSATPRPAMANAIRTFQEDLKGKAGPGYVIHPRRHQPAAIAQRLRIAVRGVVTGRVVTSAKA